MDLETLETGLRRAVGRRKVTEDYVAASLVEQVEAVADATDTRTVRYSAIVLAALRGREHEAREVIDVDPAILARRQHDLGDEGGRRERDLLLSGLSNTIVLSLASTIAALLLGALLSVLLMSRRTPLRWLASCCQFELLMLVWLTRL